MNGARLLGAALPESRQQHAEHGLRIAGMRGIVRISGCSTSKPPVVASIKYPPSVIVSETMRIAGSARRATIAPARTSQKVDHRPDHPRRGPVGAQIDHRRQPVLRRQPAPLLGVEGLDPRADDRPVEIAALLEEPVQVEHLVGAMEVADADVEDAGLSEDRA